MKYVIEIPDGTDWIQFCSHKDDSISIFSKSIFDCDIIPYTEPDEDEIRQKVEQEVWDFAREMISTSENEVSEMWECTTDFGEVMHNTTYSEAKAKYDAWKKQKEEIRVGDEVIIKSDGVKGVVLDEDLCREFYVFTENGCCEAYRKIHFEKTGRHFSEVGELLKKMKEGKE